MTRVVRFHGSCRGSLIESPDAVVGIFDKG
jgi:hypothetical protein